MTAQSVILPLPSDHARFLVLRLKYLSIAELKEKLADLFSTRDRLITQHPHAQIKTGVAFGPELWAQLYQQSPEGFKQLQPIQGEYPMPVVPADVIIHLASARADICFALSQAFFEGIQDKIFSIDETSENVLLAIKNKAYSYFYYARDLEEDSESELSVIEEFFGLDVSQFIKWYKYIFDDLKDEGISYYTLHGSKGLEFDNVVVVLQDNFAKKKDYCKYFFENYDNRTDDVNRFNEIRNLLYVACSRAKINLHVVYIAAIQENILANIESIFGKIQNLI